MAKDLVRTRHHVQKFYAMKTQLQAVGLRIQVFAFIRTRQTVC
jgi:charged multivesicular body protein 2A